MKKLLLIPALVLLMGMSWIPSGPIYHGDFKFTIPFSRVGDNIQDGATMSYSEYNPVVKIFVNGEPYTEVEWQPFIYETDTIQTIKQGRVWTGMPVFTVTGLLEDRQGRESDTVILGHYDFSVPESPISTCTP